MADYEGKGEYVDTNGSEQTMADYEGKGEYVDTNGSSPLQRAIHADPDDYSDSKSQIHYTNGFVLKNCDKVALKTSNIAPSRSSMPDATREALPKALEKFFQAHKVCSFEHIRQCLIEMALIEAVSTEGMCKELIVAASAVGYREELLQIINQVAIEIHDVFVSKSSTDYPQYDGLRRIVIDLLKAERNAKLEKVVVIEAAKMQLNREVTDTEFQKVISEFCTSQGSAWVLKCGDPDPN